MANALYTSAKEAFISGAIDLTEAGSDVIKAALIYEDYSFSAAHSTMNNVTAGNIADEETMTGKTVTAGVFDATDEVYSTVAADTTAINAIIIYKYVDTDLANNPLIAYIDTAGGLPFTPSGGSVTIEWDDGASKIFKLD